MISNFWKKITIYNAALLIIFLRIYDPLISYIKEKSENNSIFAKYTDSGYIFKDSLLYNLDKIRRVTTSLINDYKHNEFEIPIPQISTIKCSFLNKLEICKDSKECFEEINLIKAGNFLYHKETGYNNSKILNKEKIINLIQENNNFSTKNKDMIEIPFYYQIIDGYSSYLNLLSGDITLIKEITQNESKINNLFFFYLLYLKCYKIIDNVNSDKKINDLLEDHEDLMNEVITSLDKNKIEQLILIINKIIPNNILNCIPDLNTRYSFYTDFQSISNMLQILLNNKKRNFNSKISNFLFFELTQKINDIFVLDEKVSEKSKIISTIKKYCFYAYWLIATIIVYFCNKYFIRHKEFYKSKTRIIRNTNANINYKKYLKYRENIEKIQQKNRSKYTKEEIEMINKLTKDQKDYIISK